MLRPAVSGPGRAPINRRVVRLREVIALTEMEITAGREVHTSA
jgi:hypothetical protein